MLDDLLTVAGADRGAALREQRDLLDAAAGREFADGRDVAGRDASDAQGVGS